MGGGRVVVASRRLGPVRLRSVRVFRLGVGPKVVVSIAPIAGLVTRVAKGQARVETLVPPGANAHTYQPEPSDAAKLSKRRRARRQRAGLNDSITSFAEENLPAEAATVFLAEAAVPQSELIAAPQSCRFGHCHQGLANRHAWLDPRNVAAYATPRAAAAGGGPPVALIKR